MRLKIKVIPGAKKAKVIEGEIWKVKVDAIAEKGKANKRLIEILASHLKISKNKIRITKGKKFKEKIIEIES